MHSFSVLYRHMNVPMACQELIPIKFRVSAVIEFTDFTIVYIILVYIVYNYLSCVIIIWLSHVRLFPFALPLPKEK